METMNVATMTDEQVKEMYQALRDRMVENEVNKRLSMVRARETEKVKREMGFASVKVANATSQYTVSEDVARVVEFVRGSAEPVSKSAICQALGIGDSRWNSVAPELSKAGLVCQGKGRHCVWTVVSGNGGGGV